MDIKTMGIEGLSYSKIKRKAKNELSNTKDIETAISKATEALDVLENLKQNNLKNKDENSIIITSNILNDVIKYYKNKINRLKKASEKKLSIKEERKVKKVKKINITDENTIEKIKEKIKLGYPILIVEPIKYIKALSEYIIEADIPLDYHNIIYCIDELSQYFVDNRIPLISQKYYIKFFNENLKKSNKLKQIEECNKEVLNKIFSYLDNYKYENEVSIDLSFSVDYDELEQYLLKTKVLSKIQKKLDLDDEEFVSLLLNYLEKKSVNLNNKFIGNQYITKILDYVKDNIFKIKKETYNSFQIKLVNIKGNIVTNNNYIYGKGLLNKAKIEIEEILEKIKVFKEDISLSNPIVLQRTLRYIINDFKDIELLSVYLKKIGKKLDIKIFNEILEKYINIILNSNNYNLIIYYQKVMEVLFEYSIFTIDEIDNMLHEKFELLMSRDSFRNREDIEYRKILLDHTYIILNKINGYYYNDLLETYLIPKQYEIIDTNNTIFTIDSEGTKIKENAFNIQVLRSSKNDDLFFLTLYTSDLSSYFLGKDFKEVLEGFINGTLKLGSEAKKYSFDEGVVRDAIAFTFKMDINANIYDIDVTKRKICVGKNYYYDTLKNDLENITPGLQKQLLRFYALGTSLIKKELEKEGKEYNSDYYSNPDNYGKVFSKINSVITSYCNEAINPYFKNLSLIDRQSVSTYMERLDNCKDISCLKELKSEIENKYQSGVIYSSSDSNFDSKYSKVSSPLREVDALINQLLAHYYKNRVVTKEESNAINSALNTISQELNSVSKSHQKKLTKVKKVVELNYSDEKDTMI